MNSVDKLVGEKVELRLAREEDAAFILELRQTPSLNKYISSTEITVEEQRVWLRNYMVREFDKKEFYFVVKNLSGQPIGTVRIYEIDYEKKECTWGSFILNSNRPDGAAYEVIDLSTSFAFEQLELKQINLDVRKSNNKAIHIYEKTKFVKTAEDDVNYYYVLKAE